MRAASTSTAALAIASRREAFRATETSFGPVLSDVARVLWPHKTAANIAALAGCSQRMAEMYLAGDSDWSGDALAVIVAEILKRHHMRNVKVLPRE